MPENSIFDGPVTSLLSILCILLEVLSLAHAKVCVGGGSLHVGGSLHDFKFSTFVGHFLSDTLASMTVKGLNCCVFTRHVVRECFLRGLLHTVNFVIIK